MQKNRLIVCLLALLVLVVNFPRDISRAQDDCGVVDNIIMPIDTSAFTLIQGFAVPSPRHDGRFHVGEDWYSGRGSTYGQAVQAVANGRVTYAYELGWGRDGGVVVIEHRLPGGTLVYSVYGHLMGTNTMPLPRRLDCVQTGQVIGAIADSRPAPHLHFEIRTHLRDTPGPGYVMGDPYAEGWQHPSRFVTNWQARLLRSHRWYIDIDRGASEADYAPRVHPLVLNDHSIVYVDSAGTTLRRATPDGRILWRQTYNTPIVGVVGFEGRVLLFMGDGVVQAISAEDGTRREDWRLGSRLASAPLVVGDWLLFADGEGGVVMIDETRRRILWQLSDVGQILRWQVAGVGLNLVVGILNDAYEVVQVSASGSLINRAQLRQAGSFGVDDDGVLLAYTLGGLWRVGMDGVWTLRLVEPISTRPSSAVYVTTGGRIFLFDGETLHAFNRDESLLWSLPLADVTGYSRITPYGALLLLTSTGGDLIAISDGGRLCQRTRIHRGRGTDIWHDMGGDGILRVALADQLIAFDWATFTRACSA